MRTLPSGIRATGQTGEHVARPVYSLQGVNLLKATESACRTCGGPIAKTGTETVEDGLRGSWRHTGTPPVPVVPDLTEAVHEARERNEKQRLHDEALFDMLANPSDGLSYREAYEAAWRRQRPVGHTVTTTRTSKSPGMGLKT